ncbi:Caltractin ICL1f (Centrin-6) [Durusdinium trenchii]|uniref:Caltractin ICL1f (Centrin-6) n=1 Tax=Durusdinium trenchii TaxID=1381693 RepID=A0ABP0R8J4_9DINO
MILNPYQTMAFYHGTFMNSPTGEGTENSRLWMSSSARISWPCWLNPLGTTTAKLERRSRLMGLFGTKAVHSDFVTLSHLRHLVDELGIQMDDDELKAMLEKAGADADDRLNMDAFYNVMRADADG